MKKYLILIPALLLKNNVMGKYGDQVTEDQLSDSVENLVNGKYIAAVEEPQPSAADLQKLADTAKQQEIATATNTLDAANIALTTAKNNAASAAPELKDAADAAVTNAQAAVDAAQAALDALNAPAPTGKNKK